METFVTDFGLPGAVILFLMGLVGWGIRQLFTGRVVTSREVDDVRADRDRWRTSAEASSAQVTKMLEEEQTSTTVLRHIADYIEDENR